MQTASTDYDVALNEQVHVTSNDFDQDKSRHRNHHSAIL